MGRLVPLLLAVLAITLPLAAQDRVANAYDAYRAGEYSAAVSTLSAVLRRNADPDAALLLARVLRETGRYQEAEVLLQGRAAEAMTPADRATELGEVLLATGKTDEALVSFEEAAGVGRGPLMARLRVAQIQIWQGRVAEGTTNMRRLVTGYGRGDAQNSEDLTAVAGALEYLGRANYRRFPEALKVLDMAIAADSTNLDAQVASGDLFLRRYAGAEAQAMYRLALSRNPHHPGALLGLAQVSRFDGAGNAFELAQRSLQANSNLVAAHVLVARQQLDVEAYPAADEAAVTALQVNPTDPLALTMLAASALLSGDRIGFESRLDTVRRVAPHDPDVFVALAEVAARNRLYHDAVAFGDSAISIDSLSWRGYALRGINRLRIGEIEQGRLDLEVAFSGDPYDVWAKNTLDLMDDVAEYTVIRTDRFEFAIPESDAELLALYLIPLAAAAWDSLSQHYGVELPTPMRLEVYPRHADFSVRTIGLVGLGALGVSFGPVIALDAPTTQPPGAFHWGTTMWHEMAHSFHMEASNYRVPRWFTEGLAVYEERRARPGWGDRIEPEFLMAYQEGRLAEVTDLNQGFMRPAYPRQILFSYYQASLVFDFIEQRWGFPVIVEMLESYGTGQNTPEIFAELLDLDMESFADLYDEYFSTRFAGPLAAIKQPDKDSPTTVASLAERAASDSMDWVAQMAMGASLLESFPDSALPFLERAKALFPEYAGSNSPYYLLAKAHQTAGRSGKVVVELQQLTARNRGHYPGLRLLTEASIDLADTSGAAMALQEIQYIYPFEADDHLRLAEWYLALDSPEEAIRERRAALALGPFNRAEALYRLALAQRAAGDLRTARSTVLEALEQAPNYDDALTLLLELRGEQ